MLLKDLLDNLIRGELNNIAIGKPEWSTGNFNYKQLIQAISLGLTELHKRFPLKKERLVIQPIDGQSTYKLQTKYATSNTSSTEPKFILDDEFPFSGLIARVDGIYDPEGEYIDFNTTKFGDKYYMLDYRTLVIKDALSTDLITLVTRAVPGTIQLATEVELDTYEIDLPETYTEALLLYAAGRATSNRGAENATNNESAIFFARFEAACATIIGVGLDDREAIDNDKLSARGFV